MADFRILQRQEGRQELDQGHVGTVAVVDAGELGPDCAGADDHDRLGHLLEVDRVIAVDDPVTVHGEAGQGLGPRAGRDHEVARVDRLAAALDDDFVLRLDGALALEDGDLVLLQQELDAAPELVDDRFFPFENGRPVDLQAIGLQAERASAMELVGQLR